MEAPAAAGEDGGGGSGLASAGSLIRLEGCSHSWTPHTTDMTTELTWERDGELYIHTCLYFMVLTKNMHPIVSVHDKPSQVVLSEHLCDVFAKKPTKNKQSNKQELVKTTKGNKSCRQRWLFGF